MDIDIYMYSLQYMNPFTLLSARLLYCPPNQSLLSFSSFYVSINLSIYLSIHSGYLSLSLDQYTNAIDHFQVVLDLDPPNIIAANNKAICLLNTCDLSRAVSSLEDLIRKDPEKNLNETFVFNLCTLYDLKSDNSQEKKKQIMALVAKFGSDSFDFSVLKLS